VTTAEFEARARLLIAEDDWTRFERAKGYCQRFANQFFTQVTGQGYMAAPSAKAAYLALKHYECDGGSHLRPGDILFWTDGKYGHVAVHIGGGRIIENTSSTRGVKLAGAIRSGTDIRSGYHIVRMPWITEAQAGPTKLIVNGRWAKVPLELRDGTHWVPLAAIARELDHETTDHRADQGKVYVQYAGVGYHKDEKEAQDG